MPPFGEAKNLREREMVEPVMPVHQLLLNRSEDPRASKRFSLILCDPCAYLFTIVKRSLGEVTQISLEFETQVGVVNLESGAISSADDVSQSVGHDSLVDHSLSLSSTIEVTKTHA